MGRDHRSGSSRPHAARLDWGSVSIDALAARQRHPELVTEVSPDDGMWRISPDSYFEIGASALSGIEEVLDRCGVKQVASILVLPCGHGRVLRWLTARFPDAATTACDINRSAVDFCARTFGAEPVYSSRRFEEVRLPRRYDLVWSGSLLTHLDLPDWRSALGLMTGALVPGGVLVFSTHGEKPAGILRRGGADRIYNLDVPSQNQLVDAFDKTGFGYHDYAHRTGYGISLSSPAFVRSVLAELPGVTIGTVLEGRWSDHQDIAYCVRDPEKRSLARRTMARLARRGDRPPGRSIR
jgi:SAM-dependent methyltransferase